MKIGIFLAYNPAVILSKEGLGRYIGNLIKGFLDSKCEITIACPKWSIDMIKQLLNDFSVDEESVNFLISQKGMAVWTLYEYLILREKRKSKKYFIFKELSSILELLTEVIVSVSNIGILATLVICFAIICILLFPIVIIAELTIICFNLVKSLLHKGTFNIKQSFKDFNSIFIQFSKSGKSIIRHTFERMCKKVEQDLVKKINLQSSEDIWYVPSLFWPEVTKISLPTVINAPDLVTTEFPYKFADTGIEVDNCLRTLQDGKYFITYCEYVKEDLLISKYGKEERCCKAIPHINNDMRKFINIVPNFEVNEEQKEEYIKSFSRALLQKLPQYAKNNLEYLHGFDFSNIKFILYSSQARPNKNMLSLFKAYRYLLRERYCSVKLFITGDISQQKECMEYIQKNCLQYDIISFYNVPVQILAAMYQEAELSVNPTLYEGGFPFTFGEGMSVGTPSVMSNIPQVMEVMGEYTLDEVIFDPYDWRDIADKIEYALKQKDEVLKKELLLYKKIEKRNPELVANEYLAAFKEFRRLNQ